MGDHENDVSDGNHESDTKECSDDKVAVEKNENDEEDGERDDDELSWAEKEEKYGRAWVEAERDPYDPDPALERYLGETDNSLDNEDLGLDKDGNREDD